MFLHAIEPTETTNRLGELDWRFVGPRDLPPPSRTTLQAHSSLCAQKPASHHP